MNKAQIIDLGLSISLLILLAMASLPLFRIEWTPAPYVYAVGAIGTLVFRIFDRYNGTNPTLKRLYRLSTVSSLCYVMSAGIMLYGILFDPMVAREWLAFLTAGAIIQVYTSFRIQHEEKKSK